MDIPTCSPVRRFSRRQQRHVSWTLALALVQCVLFFLWGPAFLFADPRFFYPRATRQVALNFSYVHDARFACQMETANEGRETGPDLVLLVLSTAGRVDFRHAIRQTYGSLARSQSWPEKHRYTSVNEDNNLEMMKFVENKRKHIHVLHTEGLSRSKEMNSLESLKIVFLLGQEKPQATGDADLLSRESDQYGDIVQWNGLQEDYHNLTLKVLLGLRWVKEYCPHAVFVAKTDDNAFIHLPRLFTHIKQTYALPPKPSPLTSSCVPNLSSLYDIFGYVCRYCATKRSGKYAVSFRTYPFIFYPHYTFGPLYVMTSSLAFRILRVCEYLPYNEMEDVHVTGILAQAVDAHHRDFTWEQFGFWTEEPPTCAFVNTSMIVVSNYSPQQLRQVWETLKNGDICKAQSADS